MARLLPAQAMGAGHALVAVGCPALHAGRFWHIVSTDSATLAADMRLLLLIIGNLVAWLVLWRRRKCGCPSVHSRTTSRTAHLGFRHEIPALPVLVPCFAVPVTGSPAAHRVSGSVPDG